MMLNGHLADTIGWLMPALTGRRSTTQRWIKVTRQPRNRPAAVVVRASGARDGYPSLRRCCREALRRVVDGPEDPCDAASIVTRPLSWTGITWTCRALVAALRHPYIASRSLSTIASANRSSCRRSSSENVRAVRPGRDNPRNADLGDRFLHREQVSLGRSPRPDT